MWRLIFLTVAAVIAGSGEAWPRDGIFAKPGLDSPTYVYTCGRAICSWDACSKSTRTIADLLPNCLSVSRQGMLAFFEYIPAKIDPAGNSGTRLIIMHYEGEILKTLEPERPVRALTWNPEGTKMAFVTGLADEKLYDSYNEAELFIYDMGEDKTEKVFAGGARLYWAPFDGKLYIFDSRQHPVVHYFDSTSGRIEPTDYRDITFNPDGRFYYVAPFDSFGFEAYDRVTNEPLTGLSNPISPSVLKQMVPDRWYHTSWLKCLLYEKKTYHYLVNIETGEIRQPSAIQGPYVDSTVLVPAQGGGFNVVKIVDLPLVKPDELPLGDK